MSQTQLIIHSQIDPGEPTKHQPTHQTPLREQLDQ